MVGLSENPERVEALRAPGAMSTLAGNADDVTRQIEEFITLGCRQMQFRFRDFPSTEGLELFIEKVLPRFR